MTLGNVIVYGGGEGHENDYNAYEKAPQQVPVYDSQGNRISTTSGPQYGTVGDHERKHTYQGEDLGPLYLMAWGLEALDAKIHGQEVHGPNNSMEQGPQSAPPTKYR